MGNSHTRPAGQTGRRSACRDLRSESCAPGSRLITIALPLLIPAAASASLADEQTQGQNLIAQLQAGTKTCSALSAGDLDHIGEYVMFRALGSTILHQAIDDGMRAMLDEQGETRMHQLLGARYAGCSTRTTGSPAAPE